METSFSQSTLEMLPDEILLKVCKYLLCTDILHSFIGLNYRLTQMITQYRHHVSLHKTSISKFDYLCVNVLPQIGAQIRSLLIDCCYSSLQAELFIQHCDNKMATIFPRLERISLVSYQHDQLIAFLSSLRDLSYLVEIRLYSLFSIERLQQPKFVRSLLQANNHRLTTILIDDQSSALSFDRTDCYMNVLQLRIKLRTFVGLSSLFAAVPNVHHLDVILGESDDLPEYVDEMNLSSLFHLTDFRLQSTEHIWKLEEFFIIFSQIPTVRHLSLILSTCDRRLIQGDIVLSALPPTVQQFDYAIYFFNDTPVDQVDEIIASWPLSHSVTCFCKNEFLFIHTLPWRFASIELSALINKMTSCYANNVTDYDRSVEHLYLKIDRNFTLTKSLSMISQYRRVREITIYVQNNGDAVKGTCI